MKIILTMTLLLLFSTVFKKGNDNVKEECVCENEIDYSPIISVPVKPTKIPDTLNFQKKSKNYKLIIENCEGDAKVEVTEVHTRLRYNYLFVSKELETTAEIVQILTASGEIKDSILQNKIMSTELFVPYRLLGDFFISEQTQ